MGEATVLVTYVAHPSHGRAYPQCLPSHWGVTPVPNIVRVGLPLPLGSSSLRTHTPAPKSKRFQLFWNAFLVARNITIWQTRGAGAEPSLIAMKDDNLPCTPLLYLSYFTSTFVRIQG